MAWQTRTEPHKLISEVGIPYYGRRAANGRWAKAGNLIQYERKVVEVASNNISRYIYNELKKMSKAFFDSYSTGTGGDMLPLYTGNLIDSTSIVVAMGDIDNDSFHVSRASVAQHWGNWDGITKGAGYGRDFRIDDYRGVLGLLTSGSARHDIGAILSVGIPYAGPLNRNGSKAHRHAGFFTTMSADFENYVKDINKTLAKHFGAISTNGSLVSGGVIQGYEQ